jgi:tRNA A37 threonylcarbamoyladenosine biosynthesis protein TsaE
VEWPDRLGGHLPPDALCIRFSAEGDGRRVSLEGAGWADRLGQMAQGAA